MRQQNRDRMTGWLVGEENSGGQLDRRLMCPLPVERRQLSDGLIGRGGQPLEHVFKIRMGSDVVQPAVGDERVDHRAALARFFRAEKTASCAFPRQSDESLRPTSERLSEQSQQPSRASAVLP